MNRARLLAALCIALALAACVSEEAIIPVRAPDVALLCIKNNPDVVRPDFVVRLRHRLEERGFRTLQYDADAPAECRYRLLYWAGWRWDLEEYLYFAALRVYDGTKLVGQSSYDDRYGARLAKYGSTEEKIAAMVEKLFPDHSLSPGRGSG